MKKLDLKKKNTINGYEYVYDADHPLANKSGIVYVHRYIMSVHLGRWVTAEEQVHHVDGNRKNNVIGNLEVMSSAEHARMHNTFPVSERLERSCKYCGDSFEDTIGRMRNREYCSQECCKKSQRRFEIKKEELEKLLWEIPTTQIAKMFGVSGKAVEKRAKKYGLSKPPRGYWAKKKAGKI
jgi:hypothetical protein